MGYRKNTYIALGVVCFVSIISAWLIQVSDFFKWMISTPATIALFTAIYQTMRDQAAFEKQKYFDDRKRIFDIGATSHMANMAFDKHVAFCEEYMQEVHSTIDAFFRNGLLVEVLGHVKKSVALRKKYAAWLTDDINIGLEPYEKVVGEIGIGAEHVNAIASDPYLIEERKKTKEDIYNNLKKVLGIDSVHKESDVYDIEAVKKRIKEILGIEELTRIRKYLIAEAVAALEKNN